MDEIVHYRYSNKPVVVATVDVTDGKDICHSEVIEFLESEEIKFDYLVYNEDKLCYSAMRFKKGFEKCGR